MEICTKLLNNKKAHKNTSQLKQTNKIHYGEIIPGQSTSS